MRFCYVGLRQGQAFSLFESWTGFSNAQLGFCFASINLYWFLPLVVFHMTGKPITHAVLYCLFFLTVFGNFEKEGPMRESCLQHGLLLLLLTEKKTSEVCCPVLCCLVRQSLRKCQGEAFCMSESLVGHVLPRVCGMTEKWTRLLCAVPSMVMETWSSF